jgi:hypothetical protein
MNFICNKKLSKKIQDLEEIGVEEEMGLIMGIKRDDTLIPLSEEILELVAFSLWNKSKIIHTCSKKFKLTVEEIVEKV